MSQEFSIEYARALDAADPLKEFRDQFYFPKHNGKEVIYFTGNSESLFCRIKGVSPCSIIDNFLFCFIPADP